MYSVMIVEDELLVRTGLTASVNWTEKSLSVIASVDNGEQAVAEYDRLHPDILLLDIRIPKLSGLEVLEYVRSHSTRTRVVIITCQEDFATLKRALSAGITAYLLKATLTNEELFGALDKAVEELRVLDGAAGPSPLLSSPTVSVPQTAAVLYVRFALTDIGDVRLRGAASVILERLSAHGLWNTEQTAEDIVFSFVSPAAPPSYDLLYPTLTEASAHLHSLFELTPAMLYAVLPPEKTPAHAISHARDILSGSHFYQGFILGLEPDGVTLRNRRLTELLDEYRTPACLGWRIGARRQRLLEALDNVEGAFGVSWRVLDDAIRALGQEIAGPEGIFPNEEALARVSTVLNTCENGIATLTLIRTLYPVLSLHPVYGKALEETIHYIQENLSQSVSLSTLSQQVNLSPNYYALLFKTAVGLSVTEYIARLRQDRACELLAEGNLTIQQISQSCGFSDVTYFSRFFKGATGLPPHRWQQRYGVKASVSRRYVPSR